MTVKFETASGSLYEVNEEQKTVRRLIGVKNPTPRQGEDGEWKTFVDMTGVIVGQCTLFVWSYNKEASDVINARTTRTSMVKKVIGDNDYE